MVFYACQAGKRPTCTLTSELLEKPLFRPTKGVYKLRNKIWSGQTRPEKRYYHGYENYRVA